MKTQGTQLIAKNRKAFHDYEILEKFEAGLQLVGTEVKAIRNSNVAFRGSYIVEKGSRLYVLGMHVGAYKPAGAQQHEPLRSRLLLLKEKEIERITSHLATDGGAAVPLDIYSAHGLLKVTVALAKGKKQYDKRRSIKEREVARNIQRAVRRTR